LEGKEGDLAWVAAEAAVLPSQINLLVIGFGDVIPDERHSVRGAKEVAQCPAVIVRSTIR
jgi:hypothetical protein